MAGRKERGGEVAAVGGEPVLVPLVAAVVAVALAAGLGGGRYPLAVDTMVYLAIGLLTWMGARQVVYRARFRREDQAAAAGKEET